MVNKRLKQTFVRSFVNDSDEENSGDEDDCLIINGKDLEPLKSATNCETDCQQLNDCFETKAEETKTLNTRFVNFKVIVKVLGKSVERSVDIDSDLNPLANPYKEPPDFDELMGCRDLKEFEKVLYKKTTKTSETSRKVNQKAKKNKKKKKSHKSDSNVIDLDSLRSEGILKVKSNQYKCLVCELDFTDRQSALNHIKSEGHSKQTFGDDLKGTDALFTIDSESIGDIEIAIARKSELKKISSTHKENYLKHGIRLKNGFGASAYICSKCNLSFESLNEVLKHMESFVEVLNESVIQTKDTNECNGQQNTLISTTGIDKLDQKLNNEGIKSTESSDEHKYFCYFCNIYFDFKKTAVSHMNDLRHKKSKKGENMCEIDANFTVQSDRINEFEVAFNRKHVLKIINRLNKIKFTNESIRLKDGIGLNAFICEKCNLSLETIDEIKSHINSVLHSKPLVI